MQSHEAQAILTELAHLRAMVADLLDLHRGRDTDEVAQRVVEALSAPTRSLRDGDEQNAREIVGALAARARRGRLEFTTRGALPWLPRDVVEVLRGRGEPARALGQLLQRVEGKEFDGFKFGRVGTVGNRVRWSLVSGSTDATHQALALLGAMPDDGRTKRKAKP